MIVGQTEKRCHRCKQIKPIEEIDWMQCKTCNAEQAAKRARRKSKSTPLTQKLATRSPKKPRIKPEDMLFGMRTVGVVSPKVPIIELNLGEPRRKYRWHPLYALLNGVSVGAWVVIRLSSSDDVRKARLALQDALCISYIQDFHRYHYETKIGSEPTDLWVCKHRGMKSKYVHPS